MDFLPISINIKNKNILIAGGGNVALQKIRTLKKFTNNITVLAPDILKEIQEDADITCVFECYQPHFLRNMFLVYACTSDSKMNALIYRDADDLGLLCCCADDPDETHFHSMGIVETKDMIVGINSKNNEHAKVCSLKRSLSYTLQARDENLKLKEKRKGKVFLVGFGPGNPDLLTKRAEKLLCTADIIFYDDLLDVTALDQYEGEKVYVGKRRGNHHKEQGEINEILLEAALSGKVVVRLKGGDPLIFGRGGEERFFLEQKGIDVEVVPGISSAIAAAAYADIPLTHRGVSSSVAFGTAHGKDSYKVLESDTSVYYMGARNIRQVAQKYLDAGYPKDFPVGLVRNVSMENQEVIKTTIDKVASGEHRIASPLISIFGYTVTYKEKMLDALKKASALQHS